MAKQSGLGDNLYVAGNNLSGDVGALGRVGGGPAVLEVTGIDKSAPERLGGLRDGAIEFATWFNDSLLQEHVTLKGLPTTDVQLTYCRGTALGAQAASLVAKQVNYDWSRGADGALAGSVSASSNGFGIEWGTLVTAGQRTDTTATSPATGVDFTTVTTGFGLQMYLHVFAFTGTSVTVKLQDSADNATFADIAGATFVAATGPGTQRVAVAGTVRRYIRAVTTGTFSNAVFAVNVVRNETAVVF